MCVCIHTLAHLPTVKCLGLSFFFGLKLASLAASFRIWLDEDFIIISLPVLLVFFFVNYKWTRIVSMKLSKGKSCLYFSFGGDFDDIDSRTVTIWPVGHPTDKTRLCIQTRNN